MAPTYERLVALNNKYDPTKFFNSNRNIQPTVDRKVWESRQSVLLNLNSGSERKSLVGAY